MPSIFSLGDLTALGDCIDDDPWALDGVVIDDIAPPFEDADVPMCSMSDLVERHGAPCPATPGVKR